MVHEERCPDSPAPFVNFVQKLSKTKALKNARNKAASKLESMDRNAPPAERQRQRDRIIDLEDKIDQSKKASKLELLSGPIVQGLDKSLQERGIHVQAYHGRSFVGNHCVKYIKEETISHVCDSLVDNTKALCHSPSVVEKAVDVANKFKVLNSLFLKVHDTISHQRAVTEKEAYLAEENIDSYLKFYRKHFPNKTIPKHHILEDHAIPFILNFKIGLGLLGEQGGEAMHSEFNQLQRRAYGVKHPLNKLMVQMREQLTKSSPSVQQHIVPPKKRKLCTNDKS